MFVLLHRRWAQKVVSANKLNRNEDLEKDILSFIINIQREKKPLKTKEEIKERKIRGMEVIAIKTETFFAKRQK